MLRFKKLKNGCGYCLQPFPPKYFNSREIDGFIYKVQKLFARDPYPNSDHERIANDRICKIKYDEISKKVIQKLLNRGPDPNSNHVRDLNHRVDAHVYEQPSSGIPDEINNNKILCTKMPRLLELFGIPKWWAVKPTKVEHKIKEAIGGNSISCTSTMHGCPVFAKVTFGAETNSFLDEVKTLVEIGNHPNIIRLLGCYIKKSASLSGVERGIIFELFGVNLEEFIKSKRYLAPSKMLQILNQVVDGMIWIHKLGFVHGDITPMNILIKEYGDTIVVKICDFGCSQHHTAKSGNSGHREYRAPELIPNVPPTFISDIYAFGYVILDLFRVPSWDIDKKKYLDKLSKSKSLTALETLALMCCASPESRKALSFKKIKMILSTIQQ